MSEKNDESHESTSGLLSNIYKKNLDDRIKVSTILQSIDRGGFALFILILGIILIVPTPFGLSTIGALLIMFLSFQMMMGFEEVWLPKFIAERSISRKVLAVVVEKSSTYLYKLERFTRRRFSFMEYPVAEKVIGFVIFFLALITLPPIPFSNSIPGIAISLISFGFLNKDGVIVIVGFVVGIISVFVVWLMFWYGKALIIGVFSKFFR